MKNYLLSLIGLLILSACNIQNVPIQHISSSAVPETKCLEKFPVIPIKQPLKTNHSFSEKELKLALEEIYISSICIPSELGLPFARIDWDISKGTADKGKKFIIGFVDPNLKYGDDRQAWGNAIIEYSTYDFAIGASFFTYAEKSDHDKISSQNPEITIRQNGQVKGIVQYLKNYIYEPNDFWLEKRVVFPFENYYIAAVYKFKGDYKKNAEEILADLKLGNYPLEEKEQLEAFDTLVQSLSFSDIQ